MHSIRTKISLATIGAIIITMIIAAVFGVAAIRNIGQDSSEQMLRLLCDAGQKNLNAGLQDVEQNVQTISAYVESDLDGLEDLSEDDLKFVSSFLETADFDGITLMRGDGDLETFTKEIQYTPTTIFVDSSGKQACEAIIGAEDDIKTVYTEHINKALEAMGKEPIS